METITLKGKPLTGGVSIGRVCLHREDILVVAPRAGILRKKVEDEKKRLLTAIEKTKNELHGAYDSVAKRLSSIEAEVFNAHIMILEDFSFISNIEEKISGELLNSEAALMDVVKAYEEKFKLLPNDYFRERINDINDIARRLLNNLGVKHSGFMCAACNEDIPVIVAANDLLPSVISGMGDKKVKGVVVERGSLVSHGAILARALGVPVMIGVDNLIENIYCGAELLIDSAGGDVYINPEPEIIERFKNKLNKGICIERKCSSGYISTKDGTKIRLSANAGNVKDISIINQCEIRNIGLFRTEFIFIEKKEEPGIDEQVGIYRKVIDSVADTVTFRLLDIGGDKILDFLPIPEQDNPNLGLKGVRIYDRYPEIITNQIKALLIAKGEKPVKIMIPMVSTVEEFVNTRKKIYDILDKLKKDQQINPDNLQIGCMIEVPAAVYLVKEFLAEADFLSIGTNDLIQYVMGVDRANNYLMDLADPFQPAVIRVLKDIVVQTKGSDKEITICGEIAGDPAMTGILVGLGYRYLSINPYSIDGVGEVIRGHELKEFEEETDEILKVNTLENVKEIVIKQQGLQGRSK